MPEHTDKAPKTLSPDIPLNTPKTACAYGKAIEAYRTHLDISQEELSLACGLGRNAVNEIEGGKRKKIQRGTVSKIVVGLNALGLEVTVEEFDAKVAEYEVSLIANLNYTDPHYRPNTTIGRQDLTCLLVHIPAARKIVSEISKHNSEVRFVRGITNTLNRIKKMANPNHPFELEVFCTLMKQFDSYVQEAERKKLKDADDIFSLKSLREKLDGFENELGQFYPEYKDGLIPNDWPCETIKHHDLIEALFSEIQQRKFKLDDISDIHFRDKGLNTLEELEIELDRNPLHLKNINGIRARLEELDRDIFQELLISSQLLLGVYADQLPSSSIFRDTRDAPEMVIIPAGEFLMGSAEGEGEKDERPQHKVIISMPIAVGRYPVTFEEWDHYRLYHPEAHNPDDQGWGRERRPVMNVSWEDAKSFLDWLRGQTKRSYRLLSEAEWEYACRAGTDTEYHFGDDEDQLKDHAWYRENSEGKTKPVGQKKHNQFGLYDMHGNVWEWCEDHWYDDYNEAPTEGSAWWGDKHENEDDFRVMRGCSWNNSPEYLRARARFGYLKDSRYGIYGFRVARTL